MRILKIFGDINIEIDAPEDAEIIEIDINEYRDTEYEEKFDLIFCIHALQTFWAHEVNDVIKKLVDDLAHMGELHIHVPAVEQAAKSLLKNETDPLSFYMIWGTQNRPFHCGFTLLWLRAAVTQAGGLVRDASFSRFNIKLDDKELGAIGHAVLATVVRS